MSSAEVAPGSDGSPMIAPSLRSGDVLAGKYRVERLLGKGGMGTVLLATHVGLGRLVALKILAPGEEDETTVARFVREAKTVAEIASEFVVQVHDFGTFEGGGRFLEMEYLEGKDMAAALGDEGPFSIERAADCVVQACAGLAEAHARRIVHRDVKPSNLFMVQRASGATALKVLDLGIAKARSHVGGAPGITSARAPLGSPPYMSPEQIADPAGVDPRADVWSLGVVLYELISGVRPFDGSSLDELFLAISRGAPLALDARCAGVPAELASIVDHCLAKDPVDRIADVGALSLALQRFCSPDTRPLAARAREILAQRGQPTEAPRPPAPPEDLARSATESVTARDEEATSEPGADRDAGAPVFAGRLIGSTVAGRFRIERLLGRGAMGEIYEATTEAGEVFAIKVMAPRFAADATARERLLNEARAAAELRSEHVVRILDTGVCEMNCGPFIVMERLLGQNLAEEISARGALGSVAVARIFMQVCLGLAEAHAQKLVHRDIKPANIFLHREVSGDLTVKICDFGIAKIAETEAGAAVGGLTRTGILLGSPMYMSPEQMRTPSAVDEVTDVWSVCVSMYEALSGENPWARCSSVMDVGIAICTQDVPPLSEAAPGLDAGLVEVVQRGLVRDKAARWRSVTEIASALERFAEGDTRLTGGMLDEVSRREPCRVSELAPQPVLPVPAAMERPAGRRRGMGVVGAAILLATGGLVLRAWVQRPPQTPLAASIGASAASSREPSVDMVPAALPASAASALPSRAADAAPSADSASVKGAQPLARPSASLRPASRAPSASPTTTALPASSALTPERPELELQPRL